MKHGRWLAGLLLLVASGCARTPAGPSTITLATTTSTRDSGLLDVLIPAFTGQTGIEVKVVAVGSGQALEMGRRGDAEVLLVHSPAAEDAFMKEGHGRERRAVMTNDFVLVGPARDPAGIRASASLLDAFRGVARRQAPFVSRADDSGTHQKELAIWRAAGTQPAGDWYLKAGTGMAQALRLANEKTAYILADRGTLLALRDGLDLRVVAEGDPLLLNPYHVILSNPERHPGLNHGGARRLADFLTSPATRGLIGNFGRDRYGQALFIPADPGS